MHQAPRRLRRCASSPASSAAAKLCRSAAMPSASSSAMFAFVGLVQHAEPQQTLAIRPQRPRPFPPQCIGLAFSRLPIALGNHAQRVDAGADRGDRALQQADEGQCIGVLPPLRRPSQPRCDQRRQAPGETAAPAPRPGHRPRPSPGLPAVRETAARPSPDREYATSAGAPRDADRQRPPGRHVHRPGWGPAARSAMRNADRSRHAVLR